MCGLTAGLSPTRFSSGRRPALSPRRRRTSRPSPACAWPGPTLASSGFGQNAPKKRQSRTWRRRNELFSAELPIKKCRNGAVWCLLRADTARSCPGASPGAGTGGGQRGGAQPAAGSSLIRTSELPGSEGSRHLASVLEGDLFSHQERDQSLLLPGACPSPALLLPVLAGGSPGLLPGKPWPCPKLSLLPWCSCSFAASCHAWGLWAGGS